MNDLRLIGRGTNASVDARGSMVVRAVLVAALALLWVGFGPTSAHAANPAADIEQCRNGAFGSPEQCTGSAWQNGNLGDSNSHYREGDSVPFRAVLTNLSTSGAHTVVIEYDTIDNGAHAYDYLTSYDRTETTAAPCSGVSPCVPGTAGAIPVDPTIAFANPDSAQVPGAISIWNGSVTSVVYGTADAAGKRSVTVSFTATDSRVVLAWGGHIASQIDWGAGNSAGSISGSPYHMRLLDLDGDGLGNMDRSLKASSVAPVPAGFSTQVSATSITLGQAVTDLATLSGPNGPVSGNVSFFVCGPNLVSNPSCASGGSAVGSAMGLVGGQATSPGFVPTQPGKYCFRAEYAPDMFAQYSPSEHTNMTTECFEAMPQPPRPAMLYVIKHVVNDNGGTAVAADFAITVSGSNPSPGSFNGREAPGTYVRIDAGHVQRHGVRACRLRRDVRGLQRLDRAGRDQDLHDHERRQAGEADRDQARDQRQRWRQGRRRLPVNVNGSSPSPASFNGAEAPGTAVSIGSGCVQRHRDGGPGLRGQLLGLQWHDRSRRRRRPARSRTTTSRRSWSSSST